MTLMGWFTDEDFIFHTFLEAEKAHGQGPAGFKGGGGLPFLLLSSQLPAQCEENKPLLSALKALVPLPWGSTHGACERPCLQQLSYWVLRSNIRMLKGQRHLVLSRCKTGRQE